MKKTQFIELIKTIKKTIVSFISIIFFIVLGTALFLGIGWSTKAFTKTLDKTLNDNNVYDLQITYPYGLDDEVLDLISSVDGIEKVEGVYTTEAFFNHASQNYQAKIISTTKDINTYSKIVGDIPSKKGEIAVERFWAEAHDVKVGDTITFKHDKKSAITLNDLLKEDVDLLKDKKIDADGMNYLNCDSFVVTALLETGTYINHFKVTYGVSSNSGIQNDCIMYATKDSFDKDTFAGYSEVVVLCPSFHGDSYMSSEYQTNFDNTVDAVKDVLNSFCNGKYNKVQNSITNLKNEVHGEYDDGLKEYEDGLKKIKDAEKKIKDGEKELVDGKKQLEDGQIEINNGWNEVNSGLAQYNKAKQELKEGNLAFDTGNDFIKTYVYVKENQDTLLSNLNDINTLYLSVYSYFENNLPDDFYAIQIIYDYSKKTSSYSLDTSEFAAEYSKMLYDLSRHPNFVSYQDIVDKYFAYQQSMADGSDKTDCEAAIICMKNLIYDVPDYVTDLPNSTFDLYKSLLKVDPEDVYNNEAIKEIDKYLSDFNLSFKDFAGKLIDDLVNSRQTFDELYSVFVDQMKVIGKWIDENPDKYSYLEAAIFVGELFLDDAWDQLNDGKKQLDDAIDKLNEAQKQVDEGWVEYYKNKKLLEDSKIDLAKGKKELADAKIELDKAKKDIDEFDEKLPVLKEYDASILGRKSNGGIASADVANEVMGNIKYTMALLFIIVGAFVCYSALSRIVNEQTVLIGTKKALGFNAKEITNFYLLYGIVATLVGSILGTLIARFIVERVIVIILSQNYTVGKMVMHFSLKESLLFFAFELAISLSATFLACNKNLKRRTTELLANQNVLLGKKRFFEDFIVWKKLPLLIKTIINNCLNDTKRVFATLIGIIGSCSLLVCAVVLITNINETYDYQMKSVTAFDTMIYFDTENDDAIDNISKVLNKNNIEYTTSLYSTCIVKSPDDTYLSDAFFSYDDNKFKDYFHIILDDVPITNTNGLYITKTYASTYDLKVGDNITFYGSSGEEIVAPIAGIFDFYLLRGQIIVPYEYYETLFGKSLTVNTFVFNRGEYSIDELYDLLNPVDGFVSVFDYEAEAKQLYSSLTSSVMIIVVMFFALSVVLALLVLLNLMVMFVDEKKRELIVLMINGFDRSDAKKYIYGDTIFLTIIGVFFGILLGVTVGFATLKSFDSECVTVMRNINIPSYLLCALGTAILTAITCLIALRKIDKFSLTDINKA